MDFFPFSLCARNIINLPALIGSSIDVVEAEDTKKFKSTVLNSFDKSFFFNLLQILVEKYEPQKSPNQPFCSFQLRLSPSPPN